MTEILSPAGAASSLLESREADEGVSTHDRLLASAAALFAERGYGGTSMADIAERVGVRKASLYNYYASKEDLLMDLLRRGMEAAHGACLPALAGPGSHRRRLWDHFRATVRFTVEHSELVAIFRIAATQIGGDLGARVDHLVSEHRRSFRAELSSFFLDAREAGAVADADPEDLSYVFRMFTNGVLTGHLGACDVDERLDDERLERVWNLFWSGIGGATGA